MNSPENAEISTKIQQKTPLISLDEGLKHLKGMAEKPTEMPIQAMTEDQLLDLRRRIDERLPVKRLQDMNLETELVLQYRATQALQNDVLSDETVPPNQRAQVANSCSAALQTLVKMQTELHTAERFKAIEGLMIKSLKKMPLEAAEAFIKEYEAL